MSLSTLFRIMVVAGPIFGLLGIAANHFGAARVSPEWRDLLTWSGDGSWLPNPSSLWDGQRALAVGVIVLYGLFLVAFLLGQVGLFLFWRFAPPLALATAIFGEVVALGSGLFIYLPLERLCDDICLVLEGAVLALAYFSPLRRKFRRRRVARGNG